MEVSIIPNTCIRPLDDVPRYILCFLFTLGCMLFGSFWYMRLFIIPHKRKKVLLFTFWFRTKRPIHCDNY